MRTACGERLLEPASSYREQKLHEQALLAHVKWCSMPRLKLCVCRGRGSGRGGDRTHNRQPSREAGKDDDQHGSNAGRERAHGGRAGNKDHGPGKGGRHARTSCSLVAAVSACPMAATNGANGGLLYHSAGWPLQQRIP